MVVPNCLNGAVLAGRARPVGLDDAIASAGGDFLLLYTTRAYPHKNLEFLPAVRAAAARRGIRVRFLVTLTKAEWKSTSEAFRSASVNVGPVNVSEIAALHAAADGVFFPSLLEASSATPLEALALGSPLFASDRDFVRAAAADAAHYFDPLDPDSAAEVLAAGFSDRTALEQARQIGHRVVTSLPTARERAERYLGLLTGRWTTETEGKQRNDGL